MLKRVSMIRFGLLLLLYCTAHSQTLRKENMLRDEAPTAGNGFYTVIVENFIDSGVGLYSVRTDSLHPVTEHFGQVQQDLLLGARKGLSGSSYLTVRCYDSKTDYVQSEFARHDSNFTTVWLDTTLISEEDIAPESTFFQPIETDSKITGYRVIYTLPRFDVAPEMRRLRITQIVDVHGENFDDSWVEITTIVANLSTQATHIGIRYLWDLAVGEDDGPKTAKTLFKQSFGDFETTFELPKFAFFFAEANLEKNRPEYHVFGSVLTPANLKRTPFLPDRLQLVSWPLAFFRPFDYAIHDSLDVSTNEDPNAGLTGGDNAVQYYWGDTPENALTIQPNDSIQVTQGLIASLPGDPPDLFDRGKPTCQLVSSSSRAEFIVQDTNCGLHSIKVKNSHNAQIKIPRFEKGSLEPVVVTATPIDSDLSFGMTFKVLNLCGKSITCDPIFLTLAPGLRVLEHQIQPLASDRYFYINNQGLEQIDVNLNGQDFRLVAKPIASQPSNTFKMPLFGEMTIDLIEYLKPDGNTMTITFDGPDGRRADLIIADFLVTDQVDLVLMLDPVPKDYSLSQNLPNPFRETTSIRFDIPQLQNEQQVELKVYNILGQLVRTLVKEPFQSGIHTARWNGRDEAGRHVASGVYLYRLNAGGKRLTKKMMLIR